MFIGEIASSADVKNNMPVPVPVPVHASGRIRMAIGLASPGPYIRSKTPHMGDALGQNAGGRPAIATETTSHDRGPLMTIPAVKGR